MMTIVLLVDVSIDVLGKVQFEHPRYHVKYHRMSFGILLVLSEKHVQCIQPVQTNVLKTVFLEF